MLAFHEGPAWSTAGRKRISAVIACYRDAPAVPIMYQRLKAVCEKIDADYEIIFVNDASPDDAAQVLAALAQQDPRVVVINHARNFGSQSAFTSGMRIATGDAVVLLDGDLQDPELIEAFYHTWRQGYDVVYGERVKREATLFLKLAYRLFYRLFRAASYVPIPLDAGDFSLIDRRVVDALNGLPENNRFLRGLRAWVGYRQIGVPYVRPERMFGHTTNSLLRNLGWARKAIFSFSYLPIDLITWLAFAMVSLAACAIVAQIIVRLAFPTATPSGFTTLIVLILFLGGIQLLCLGIIGSYLAHIYDEVKRRPPYIVESILNRPATRAPQATTSPACRQQRALTCSTRCAICGTTGAARELYPASFTPDAFAPAVFSARRLPDRVHYRVVRCARCGLVRSDPIADAERLHALYARSTFDYGAEVANLRRTYGRSLARLERFSARKGSLLEIGCGNGFLLDEALAQGYAEVRGVEPSADAIGRASPAVRAQIVCDIMRPGLFEAAQFDVVCLFQVFDHVADPGALLDECLRVLRPGGLLLAINHNVAALSARAPRSRSPIIDIEHTYLYSPATMRRIVRDHGFDVVEVAPVWNSYTLHYLTRLLPLPNQIKRLALHALQRGPVGKLRLSVPLGNLRCIARRPNPRLAQKGN